MSDLDSVNVFLDENVVDELWTLIKQDGLEIERAKEVVAKVEAKGKFGIGKLWSWMASDLNAELSGDVSRKQTRKLEITSIFRAMLLPELIKDDVIVLDETTVSPIEVVPGSFIEISATTLELIPLPTLARFLYQMMISAIGDAEDDKDVEKSMKELISYAETFTGSERAMTFLMRVDPRYEELSRSSHLAVKYFEEAGEEVFNALCMSKDDHVLALMQVPFSDGTALVVSVLEERYLRRNLAMFTLNRPVRAFGRVAGFRLHESLGMVIGLQPITISLTK